MVQRIAPRLLIFWHFQAKNYSGHEKYYLTIRVM